MGKAEPMPVRQFPLFFLIVFFSSLDLQSHHNQLIRLMESKKEFSGRTFGWKKNMLV